MKGKGLKYSACIYGAPSLLLQKVVFTTEHCIGVSAGIMHRRAIIQYTYSCLYGYTGQPAHCIHFICNYYYFHTQAHATENALIPI